MNILKLVYFIFISSRFINNKNNLSFIDLNFKKSDFTNYKQIKLANKILALIKKESIEN